MQKVEIAIYGKDDARIWHRETEVTEIALAWEWLADQQREADLVYHNLGGHFIDQHIYDPERDK